MTVVEVDANLQVEDNGSLRPLSVDDLLGNTGGAQEDSLQDLIAKLPAALNVDGGLKVHLLNPPTNPPNTVGIDGSVTIANPTANPETGLAKEVTLAAIEARLVDLASEASAQSILTAINLVAKDASVDNVEGALVTLNGKDFATNAKLTAVEALLTQVVANTGTASAEIANLELTADQISLDTDELESILTSINGKDFATQATATASKAVLDAINTKLGGTLTFDKTGLATDAKLDSIITALGGTLVVSGPLTNAQLTAAALATSAKQDSIITLLGPGLPNKTFISGAQAFAGILPVGNMLQNSGTTLKGWGSAGFNADGSDGSILGAVGAFGWNGASYDKLRSVSGSLKVVLDAGASFIGSLNAGNNRVGATSSAAFWTDETSTPLAAAGTFTGASKDLTASTAGNFQTGYPRELRASAVSDQTGTLHLEISRDNATWRRIKSIATVAVGALFVAELTYFPSTRYARLVYVNGATLQGHGMVQSMLVA